MEIHRLKKLRKKLYEKAAAEGLAFVHFEGLEAELYVKPSNHEQKKKRKYRTDISRREDMAYNAEEDSYGQDSGGVDAFKPGVQPPEAAS